MKPQKRQSRKQHENYNDFGTKANKHWKKKANRGERHADKKALRDVVIVSNQKKNETF